MFRKQTAGHRLTLVVLLMCAVICAQAFSLASEQFHQHSSQHCCALCHAGPMPFLKTAACTAPAPMGAVAWLAGSYDSTAAHEVLLSAGDSRAPPA
ncbi:MAG TPA: hypothetical protein VGF59_34375 [Bryobacteraceae bacterium]|jgi:hypothetical protein